MSAIAAGLEIASMFKPEAKVAESSLGKYADDVLEDTRKVCDPGCFIAGTKVLTSNGLKAIEEIEVGDVVIATDPQTGETEEKEVVETYVNQTDELIHITVDGEEIVTTPNHPFYVPEQGWTSAIKLRAGDQLQLVNGEYVIIEAIQHELLEVPIKVYNFQVNDFHTYYVGTDTQVLVHNDCSTTFSSYYSYDELKRLVKESGLSAPGKGIEVHHLLEKQFADKVGVKSGDIISIPLVPRWHRGVKGEKIIGEGLNIDNLILNELKHITGQSNFQVAHDVATAEQIWQAHRNVYERIGQADWAEAVYEAYFKKMGIKYK